MHSSAALLNNAVIAGRGKQFPPDLLVQTAIPIVRVEKFQRLVSPQMYLFQKFHHNFRRVKEAESAGQ